MRRPRIQYAGEAYYHVTSRCAMDYRLMEDDELKDLFVETMRKLEAFSGIEVINYCVMDDHFHLLIRVPAQEKELTDDDYLKRIKDFYGDTQTYNHGSFTDIKARWKKYRESGNLEALEKEQNLYKVRMGALAPFVSNLKQRFTNLFFSRNRSMSGTIWAARYNSTVIEASQESLSTISAYIDLNPVRAGLVTDPKDYKWSGYGSAARGDKKAMTALVHICDKNANYSAFNKFKEFYDTKLYVSKEDELEPEEIQEIIKNKDSLPLPVFLRCKVRYFSRGAILGSRDFVENVFEQNRHCFSKERKTASRKLGYCEELSNSFFAARALKKEPIRYKSIQKNNE